MYKHKLMDWYPVTTPSGADEISCPECDPKYDNCFACKILTYKSNIYVCPECNIVFDTGCVLQEKGCTDNTYYPKIYVNGNEIYKAPKEFWSMSDLEKDNILSNVISNSLYKAICLCKEYNCDHPDSYKCLYPKNKYPQYYKCRCE